MNSNRVFTVLAAAAFATVFASPAFATNGYFTHGTGTKNKGMAGAGLASPEDAIFIANNPAAAVFSTGQLDVGAALFSPLRSYSSSASQANGNGGAFTIGPNNLDSDREYFVIPHIAYSWQLGNESALGVAFYGRGGMNTKWTGGTATFDPDGPGPAPVTTFPGTFGAGTAGVDLSQAFLDIAYARKTSDRFAWGASLVLVVQGFEAYGVETFAPFTETFAASGGTAFPTNLSGNGHDYSFGAGLKVGIQTSLSDTVSLAAMYQTEIDMGEFDDYADLFAEQGGFDIPANAKIGITIRPNENFAISFDIEQIWYSDISSVGNNFSNLFTCPTVNPMSMSLSGCLGGANGAGFGWDDMTIFKVGIERKTNAGWTWRAGYSNGSQPIPTSEVLFNILAPAVMGGEWNFAFMYALEGSQSGPNPFDPTQNIELKMRQFELELSYSWRF